MPAPSGRTIAITVAVVTLYCVVVSFGPGLLFGSPSGRMSENAVQAQLSELPEG
jgi:hypothetical protein